MYKISPSDFAYLYEDCKLCYYLKVKHGIYQPSMPMPGVFSAINTRIQGSLLGKDLRVISNQLPRGKVISQEGWAESVIVPQTEVFIKGKYDLLVELTKASYMVVDLKISTPGDGKVDKYKSQLNAYKFALENPKDEKPINIKKLGLLIFYPDLVSFKKESITLTFPPTFLEVPIDDSGFIDFANKVSLLLSGPLPNESLKCKWCQYRHVGDQIAHKHGANIQGDLPF